MTIATDSIRSHQDALRPPMRSLAGIPVGQRFAALPLALEDAEGFQVIDRDTPPGARPRLMALCAGEADAQHIADGLNARAWAERRAEIEGAAERQGEDVVCETDR